MTVEQKKEVWLRGPVDGIIPALQPVAHALLQAQEEIHELMNEFPDALLWVRPAQVASAGFHLQHISGVLDRLFTYAAGNLLSNEQLAALKAEGIDDGTGITSAQLVLAIDKRIYQSIQQLKQLSYEDCLQPRGVGRAQIPSTVLGLLVHSAEHTMRHLGQLLVTVKVVNSLH